MWLTSLDPQKLTWLHGQNIFVWTLTSCTFKCSAMIYWRLKLTTEEWVPPHVIVMLKVFEGFTETLASSRPICITDPDSECANGCSATHLGWMNEQVHGRDPLNKIGPSTGTRQLRVVCVVFFRRCISVEKRMSGSSWIGSEGGGSGGAGNRSSWWSGFDISEVSGSNFGRGMLPPF